MAIAFAISFRWSGCTKTSRFSAWYYSHAESTFNLQLPLVMTAGSRGEGPCASCGGLSWVIWANFRCLQGGCLTSEPVGPSPSSSGKKQNLRWGQFGRLGLFLVRHVGRNVDFAVCVTWSTMSLHRRLLIIYRPGVRTLLQHWERCYFLIYSRR